MVFVTEMGEGFRASVTFSTKKKQPKHSNIVLLKIHCHYFNNPVQLSPDMQLLSISLCLPCLTTANSTYPYPSFSPDRTALFSFASYYPSIKGCMVLVCLCHLFRPSVCYTDCFFPCVTLIIVTNMGGCD